MKSWLIIPLILILVPILACASEPPPDIPRYTADQVIAVAQANSPDCGPALYELAKKAGYPRWAVEYLGGGKWEVTKTCPTGKTIFFFYEEDGSIVKR